MSCAFRLLRQTAGGHGIAQEQRHGIFIVHKVAVWVLLRQLAALYNSLAVIGGVFDDLYAFGTRHIFLPQPGVRGHMDRNAIADAGAYDADAQSQITGGADVNGVFAKNSRKVGILKAS